MSTILNDKELLDYVERLVAKRLPAGPYLMADLAWYQQVVDLTINQAFEDLQVVETLNYQISQLGEYLKKKTEDKSDLKRNNGEITMMCLVIITMRATQKKIMSKPVTSTEEGKYFCKNKFCSSFVLSPVQFSVENGHSAEENQVSRTSSSRTSVAPPARRCASASVSAT